MRNKSIAVLTSGVMHRHECRHKGGGKDRNISRFEGLGVRKGYEGLIKGEMFEMSLSSVADIIHRGGTMLQTARSPEFATSEGRGKA